MKDEELIEALQIDYRQAKLSSADRAMLDYAYKLTLTPWKMVDADVQILRDHGFTDRAIHDINQITAYYAYVNRVADGLGVSLEEFWQEDNENR